MADDLEDSGPAGSNPNASLSQPNFPDADSGGGGGGGGGGGDDSDDNTRRRRNIPAALRDAAGFVGIDVPENAQADEPDDSGGFVDTVQDRASDAVDAVQNTAGNVRDRVESGASSAPPEPSQEEIDRDIADAGPAGSVVDDPDVPNDEEAGQRNTGPGNKTGKGPFPDKGPAGSNPNVATGDVNLPDADDQGDLTDELADGRLTRSEVVAETEDVEAPGPRGDLQEERQAPLGEDPNRFQRRLRRARENLEEQAISESPAIDDPADVNIERDGQTLRAELSEQGLRGALAAQSPVIDDPQNVDVSGDPDDIAQAVNAGAVDLTAGVSDRSSSTSVPTAPTGGGSGLDGSDLPGGVPSGRANRQPATEQLSGFDLSEDADFADLGVARSRTRAPGVTQDRFRSDEDRNTVSPFAGIALNPDNDQQIKQAVQGSREIARRANQGGTGAQVAEIGRDLQEQGVGISEGIQDELPLDDVGPQVGEATVGDQVETFVGGTAGFPSQFLGGGVQAAGLAATGGSVDRDAVEQFPDRFDAATDAQVDFATSRPVEAGLIAATVAAGSPRARSAARQAGRRAARGASERAGGLAPQEFGRSFRSDSRAQLDFSLRERSRGSSDDGGSSSRNRVEIAEEGAGSPEPPQSMVERFRAREANQRIDSSVQGRRTEFDIPGPNERARARQSVDDSPARAIESELQRLERTRNVDAFDRSNFQFSASAEEAFATLGQERMQSVPRSDLRAATDVPATSRTQVGSTAAGAGRSATVGDRVGAEIGQSDFMDSDVTLDQPGSGTTGDVTAAGDTRAGPAGQATRDIQTLLEEAQRPQARVNDGIQRGSERTFGADSDGFGDTAVQLQEQAQQSEVTGGEAGLTPGGRQSGRGRTQPDLRPDEQTETGVDTGTDIDIGLGQGETNQVGPRPGTDTTAEPRVDVFSSSASVTTPSFSLDVPGGPGNTRTPDRPGRNRRPGGPPLPGFPGGGGAGGGAGPIGLEADTTFETNIASGREAVQILDSDDDSGFFNDDDDDDDGFTDIFGGGGGGFFSNNDSGGLGL